MEINDTLINTKNIAYVEWETKASNGYIWKINFVLYIYFIGKDKPLVFTFYDEEDFREIINKLKEILL